jgi:hypothetical protein
VILQVVSKSHRRIIELAVSDFCCQLGKITCRFLATSV